MPNDPEFKALYEKHSAMVYNLCLKYLQNVEDAEDVTQEVFIAIHNSLHQFKGDSKISTWIYRIAVTRSLEFIRTKSRKKRFAFFQNIFSNEKGEVKIEALHFEHPGVQLENKERAAVLFAAIDKLSENQKTAFILSKLEELSYAEIAAVMKVSVPSVESLLFRAKQSLQKILGDYYEKNEK
ncbi:MAG: RNA polymerase sigma factor [Bacteroidota bacterium]|nr:RNA polymerase sigma factor [Bacteroidota bacterium]